jgi:hypothetical protein
VDEVAVHDEKVVWSHAPTTYYVDQATGDDSRTAAQAQNQSTPWQTIQKAADAMWGGDMVLVGPGTYREQVIPAYAGGLGAPITFQARDTQNQPIVDGSEIVSTSWTLVQITDFAGNQHSVYKATIDWLPAAVYQGSTRMFASQHPNQADPADPYDLTFFMDVPEAENSNNSHTELFDTGFLTQAADDYWKNASLLLYDGYQNAIGEQQIISFVAAEHKLVTKPFGATIGFNNTRNDKYAIRHHLGVLDQEGEYYVDTTVQPYEIYVWPYAGQDINLVSAGKFSNAFNLDGGNLTYITVDGFEIRFFNGSGISARNGSDHLTIKNCELHDNMGNGFYSRGVDEVKIQNCIIYDNHNNGTGSSDGSGFLIENCDITGNGNNGVWFGNGTNSVYFSTFACTIRACYIHHQGGRRAHPDNFQMHQTQHVVIENSVMQQDGHQNMWTAYSDGYLIRNNLFLGGTCGMNAVQHSKLLHNVYYKSGLRYDAHLTNHGAFGDYFKPQEAIIRNNLFIECGMNWSSETVIPNRAEVFKVDHNYYNIENNWTRTSWTDRGLGYGTGSIAHENHDSLAVVIKQPPDSLVKTYDFSLLETSPLRDAGIDVGVTTDRDGNARPYGSAPDIGPYEWTLIGIDDCVSSFTLSKLNIINPSRLPDLQQWLGNHPGFKVYEISGRELNAGQITSGGFYILRSDERSLKVIILDE